MLEIAEQQLPFDERFRPDQLGEQLLAGFIGGRVETEIGDEPPQLFRLLGGQGLGQTVGHGRVEFRPLFARRGGVKLIDAGPNPSIAADGKRITHNLRLALAPRQIDQFQIGVERTEPISGLAEPLSQHPQEGRPLAVEDDQLFQLINMAREAPKSRPKSANRASTNNSRVLALADCS